MDVEYRAIGPDEVPALLAADQRGFGEAAREPGAPETWTRGELDRTRVGFEDGRIVGAGRNYSFELTTPGGALVPAAAVSWISVLPTHRRRGVLTGMMQALHDDARAHGEPVAMLTASEGGIYGRFGYGVATFRLICSVERAHGAFARPVPHAGQVRLLEDGEAETVFPPVYDAARRLRAGMVSRPDFWWPEVLFDAPRDAGPRFAVVHETPDGVADGYAFYEIRGAWAAGVSDKRLRVIDLITTSDRTRAALWHYLLAVDLVHTVEAVNVPFDEPLRWLLADMRHFRVEHLFDHLWVCVLDAPAALAARRYAVPGTLVLEVHDPGGGVERVSLDGGPDGAVCHATAAEPDLVLGRSRLGSVFLGGVAFTDLAQAGLVEERTPGALGRADAMFATRPVPAMISWF